MGNQIGFSGAWKEALDKNFPIVVLEVWGCVYSSKDLLEK
jgi:hypothetical protein